VKILMGRGYLLVRVGDLAFGFGGRNLPREIRDQIDPSRPHWGVEPETPLFAEDALLLAVSYPTPPPEPVRVSPGEFGTGLMDRLAGPEPHLRLVDKDD